MDAKKDGFPALCPGCGKRYRVRSRERSFDCKACGATLRIVSDVEDEAPRARAVEPTRHELAREVGRARKAVSLARLWFGLSAVFLGGFALRFWTALFPIERDQGSTAVGPLVAFGTALTAIALVAALGFALVRRQPFAWTLVMAIGQTALALVLAAWLSFPSLASLVALSFGLGWWGLLLPVARSRRIASEHPELLAVRRIRRGSE